MSDNEFENKWSMWHILLCILLSLPFVAMFLILIMAKFKLSLIIGIAFAGATSICMSIIGLSFPYSTRTNFNFTKKEVYIGLLGIIFLILSIYILRH